MAYEQLPPKPQLGEEWLAMGDAIINNVSQATTDIPSLQESVKTLQSSGPSQQFETFADLPAIGGRRVAMKNATSSTVFNKNEIIVYRGRLVMLRKEITIPAGTDGVWISGNDYVPLDVMGGVWNVNDFGLSTDPAKAAANTSALAAMFAEVKKYGGQFIDFNDGYYVFGPGVNGGAAIDVPAGMTLLGRGYRSTWLNLADNANCQLIKAHTSSGSGDPNASLVSIRDMTLDGNKSKQTVAKSVLEFISNPRNSTQGGTSEPFDLRAFVHRVEIRNGLGTGIYADGRAGHSFVDVWVQHCEGYGFDLAFDTTVTTCQAEKNGLSGFHFRSGQMQCVNSKSYLNGWSAATGKHKTTGDIHGFHADHSGAGGVLTLTGCNAQNNAGGALKVTGPRASVMASDFIADTNAASMNPDEHAAIILDGCQRSRIMVYASQGDQAGAPLLGKQFNAVRFTNGADRNTVEIVGHHSEPSSMFQVGPVVNASSSILDNVVIHQGKYIANGPEGGGGSDPVDSDLTTIYNDAVGTDIPAPIGEVVIGQGGTAVATGLRTPVGMWKPPTCVGSAGNYPQNPGEMRMLPTVIDRELTIDAIGCYVGTAQVGGFSTATLGVWASRENDSLPDFTKPVATTTIDPSTSGGKIASLKAPVTLKPGIYWSALLYVASENPTTIPQFTSATSAVGLWATGPGLAKSLRLVGQNTLPIDNTATISNGDVAVVVSFRRSA